MGHLLFQKVLIANRGEISVRVQRACHELGIQTVAVYSDADAQALHVRMAHEAVRLGPAPSTESYLKGDLIIQAAKDTGAEAIHPGYGFLSENADFARAVEAAGIVWIGPSPEAMDQMGDKVAARANAEAAGVPVAPGSDALQDAEDAAAEAERIGYPVMLKASAGGGGIGMRIVHSAKEIRSQFEDATKQAQSAFGVPDVFMEKFIERPRHIEVQILADGHGNVLHLYERECSIQRRHQKLIEEAPSPALTQEEREALGAKAVALAQHVGYRNAGTLEFLFERGPNGEPNFYFNEMNTRLQVEHPVTELITGVDLVHLQLRVAAGEKLDLQQSDIKIHGHAFEARINAEDPFAGFAPSPGPIHALTLPKGRGVRVDRGIDAGWTVPAVYDSMVLKLLTHGKDRDEAADRMEHALDDLQIDGFTTNQPFHKRLFAHSVFRAADLSTRFLEEYPLMATDEAAKRQAIAIAFALKHRSGGGLPGIQLAQRTPEVVNRHPGQRNWRSA